MLASDPSKGNPTNYIEVGKRSPIRLVDHHLQLLNIEIGVA